VSPLNKIVLQLYGKNFFLKHHQKSCHFSITPKAKKLKHLVEMSCSHKKKRSLNILIISHVIIKQRVNLTENPLIVQERNIMASITFKMQQALIKRDFEYAQGVRLRLRRIDPCCPAY
jgi:hypothetical protein